VSWYCITVTSRTPFEAPRQRPIIMAVSSFISELV
jgi:hypothetical protein